VFGPRAGVGFVLGRLTVTRGSLPIFCLVAGALLPTTWAPRRRLLLVALAGVAAGFLSAPMGFPAPDILLLLAAASLAGGAIVRWPLGAIVLALVQLSAWPLAGRFGWAGYEPGLIVGLMGAGVIAGRHRLHELGDSLPAFLEVVGRRPLAWYLGHLTVLLGLVVLSTQF